MLELRRPPIRIASSRDEFERIVVSTQLVTARGRGEVAATRRLEHAGLAYVSHHLDRLPVVVLAREARGFGLLHPFTQARTDAAETRNRRWQLFGWFVYLPMLALASIGLVVAFRERMQLGPLLGVLASVIVTIGVSYGSQRFRVLADPIILMLAAFCVVRLTQRLRQRLRPQRPRIAVAFTELARTI